MLTSTLLTTTNIALADKEMDENFINIFRDKTLITNNYFDLGESDTLKITVTGTRTERSVLDLPGSVNVYDFNEIESSSPSTWRELFSDAPGLGSQDFIRSDYSRDYAKGDAGNINIRGLEGNRILTQIDGATIPRFSYGKSTFSVSRSNFIELSNLGKIEVLKGSGSSLYGSDALGGVVTLRSLNPEDILKEDQEKAVRFSTGYKSVNSSIKPNFKDVKPVNTRPSAKLKTLFLSIILSLTMTSMNSSIRTDISSTSNTVGKKLGSLPTLAFSLLLGSTYCV